jgi:hypothetical protein
MSVAFVAVMALLRVLATVRATYSMSAENAEDLPLRDVRSRKLAISIQLQIASMMRCVTLNHVQVAWMSLLAIMMQARPSQLSVTFQISFGWIAMGIVCLNTM